MEALDVLNFCQEIQHLVQRIQLTEKMTNDIKSAIMRDIEFAVPRNYSLLIHGSFLSTLADVTSDIDFVLSKKNFNFEYLVVQLNKWKVPSSCRKFF